MDNTALPEKQDYHFLYQPKQRMHLLSNPQGVYSHMAEENLGFQMDYTVKVLEKQLREEGCYHVLEIELDEIHDPYRWILYADEKEVAAGSGEFARGCFYESSTAFLDICREAVKAANLPTWTEHEYKLLCAMRAKYGTINTDIREPGDTEQDSSQE